MRTAAAIPAPSAPRAPAVRGWTIFLAAVCLLGATLRLLHLDGKPYWFNEVFTSLKISGWDEHRDVNPVLYTGALLRARDLLVFQRPRPGSGAADVVRHLAAKDVKWPPGYFLLARVWAEHAGTSVFAMRLLPAILGLLGFPALWWLCRELFARHDVAWTAMALYGVSPLLLEQAQSARPWSLWIVLVLAASAALLGAARRRTRAAWLVYAAVLAAALYVNLWTVLLIGVHGAWVVLAGGAVARRAWSLAAALAALTFAPWALLIAANAGNAVATSGHLRTWPGLPGLAAAWGRGVVALFVVPPRGAATVLAFAALAALAAYALAVMHRTAARPAAWLVILLVASALAVIAPDLLLRHQVSSRVRYLLTALLGLQIAVAYLLAVRAAGPRAWLWRAGTAGLLLAGAATGIAAVRAATWWELSGGDVDAGRILARARQPLVVTTMYYGTITPLAHAVAPDTAFILFGRRTPIALPEWDGEIFAYRPTPALSDGLRPHGTLRPACTDGDASGCLLYRLERS